MRPFPRSATALALTLLALALPAPAEVTFAPLFQDGAVLQRETPLPLWGTADPGERVQIEFLGRSASTVADAEGRWMLTLLPVPASAVPQTLHYQDSTGDHQLQDLLVGDVWICGGQSNMEWPVRNAVNAEAEIAAADHPLIREFQVAKRIARDPRTSASGTWVTCAPDTVPHFSAVGYFFARDVQTETHIPIGLINSNWGGTSAEAWLPPAAFDDLSLRVAATSHQAVAFRGIADRIADYHDKLTAWEQGARTAQKPGAPWTPGAENHALVLNNAMIAPLAPYALRGVIWYQGEANADQPATYREIFSGVITAWREQFAQPDLPFYWVQLANWAPGGNAAGTDWAFLREAQTQTLVLPHTGQALALDIGDSVDIHPRNKQAVGHRLARLALARLHGKDIVDTGPTFMTATIKDGSIVLDFEHANGLGTTDQTAPREFEIAGINGQFHPATASLTGSQVSVTAPAVPAPRYVRYAWRNDPAVNLVNAAGLPAVPFRTDTL